MIEALADAVVARLKAELPDLQSEHFPDSPRELARFASRSEALFVSYDGSQFGPDLSLDPPSSERTVEFSVSLLVRTLRGDLGMQRTIERVRRALFGWRPADESAVPLGFSRCMPVRDGFVSEEQGAWRFVSVFRTTTTSVAQVPNNPEVSGPPLAEVDFEGGLCP